MSTIAKSVCLNFSISLMGTLVFLSSTIALADPRDWKTTVGSGNWNLPSNWVQGIVPSSGDTVSLGSFGDGAARTITYNYTGSAVTLNSLGVDLSGPGTTATTLSMSANSLTSIAEFIGYNGRGTMNHSGGTNTIAAGAGAFEVGSQAGSLGTYNLSGTGTLVANRSEIVGNAGTGVFNQTGGTNTIFGAGNSLLLGAQDNSTGSYLLSGASTLAVNGGILVGGSGTGHFEITNGGTATATFGDIVLASTSSGSVSVRGSGSTWSVITGIGVGVNAIGSMEITDGGVVTSARGAIGMNPNGIGTVVIEGEGSKWVNTQRLIVGSDDNDGGRGTLNVFVGATADAGGELIIRDDSSINLHGGTVRFDEYSRATTGNFFYHSGTIQLIGDREIGTDTAIQELFGGMPIISTGKGLTIEESAKLVTPLVLDGGVLTVRSLVNGQNLLWERGTLNIKDQVLTIGAAGPLGATLDVDDDMTINVDDGITNQGLVTGDGQIGGTFFNASTGELRVESGKSLKLTGSNNINSGRINLTGGQIEFTQNLTNTSSISALISGNGTLIARMGLTNQGTMSFAGTANIVGDVNNVVGGRIISSGGGPTVFFDDVVNNGEIRTSTNGFTVFLGSMSGGGSYTGTGTVNIEGDLTPGSSPATVSFGGDVSFGLDAVLGIELGGIVAGSEYDQIDVADDLTLDGSLEVSLLGGFVPTAGMSFDILDWGSLSGNFSTVDLPPIPGLAWDVTDLYTDGVLSVIAAGQPGDFDFDGDADGRDFLIWQRGGSHVSLSPDDLADWQANYGTGLLMATSVAVPEPSGLLLVGCFMLMIRRCPQGRRLN